VVLTILHRINQQECTKEEIIRTKKILFICNNKIPLVKNTKINHVKGTLKQLFSTRDKGKSLCKVIKNKKQAVSRPKLKLNIQP
jgi:hypothetical protein